MTGIGVQAHHLPAVANEARLFVQGAPCCPECGAEWTVVLGSGRRGSRIIGVVTNDRISEWVCPACAARWARGALVGDTPVVPGPSIERGQALWPDPNRWCDMGTYLERD